MERTALDSVLCVWCVHTAVLLTACACAGVCDVERSESKSACPCLPCRAVLVVSETEYRDETCAVCESLCRLRRQGLRPVCLCACVPVPRAGRGTRRVRSPRCVTRKRNLGAWV
jgi:hypothetical protein